MKNENINCYFVSLLVSPEKHHTCSHIKSAVDYGEPELPDAEGELTAYAEIEK
ncbi:MAG: hypothetical protein IKH59_02825 [Bacteroidaceae bacterium]|nr:hypothetical protein [Bacteroidaceae bacterium]